MKKLETTKALSISLLGDLRVHCDGVQRPLPKSRKSRALLAYLALSGSRHRRDALCEMFWEVPNDPRAALRWSLSKLRTLLSIGDASALVSDHEWVALDGDLIEVDLWKLQGTLAGNRAQLSDDLLSAMESQFAAGYLAGLDISASVDYQMWLESEQANMRRLHSQILTERTARLSNTPEEALPVARKLVSLDPLDTDSNLCLLKLTLNIRGRKEAQSVLQGIRARYRDAGLPELDLLSAWQRITAEISLKEPVVEIDLQPAVGNPEPRILERPHTLIALPDKPSVAVLVGRAVSSVMLRAPLLGQCKAHSAGNGMPFPRSVTPH